MSASPLSLAQNDTQSHTNVHLRLPVSKVKFGKMTCDPVPHLLVICRLVEIDLGAAAAVKGWWTRTPPMSLYKIEAREMTDGHFYLAHLSNT